jgi:mRNA-degrading endonuclease toxin of MazEF toxin-antitoxin module
LAKKVKPDKIRGSVWTLTEAAYQRLGIPMKERRPWLIVQNNAFNTYSSRLACPLTSAHRKNEKGERVSDKRKRDTQAYFVFREFSLVSCDDIYTIRKYEFGECCGLVSPDDPGWVEVEAALKLALSIKT